MTSALKCLHLTALLHVPFTVDWVKRLKHTHKICFRGVVDNTDDKTDKKSKTFHSRQQFVPGKAVRAAYFVPKTPVYGPMPMARDTFPGNTESTVFKSRTMFLLTDRLETLTSNMKHTKTEMFPPARDSFNTKSNHHVCSDVENVEPHEGVIDEYEFYFYTDTDSELPYR